MKPGPKRHHHFPLPPFSRCPSCWDSPDCLGTGVPVLAPAHLVLIKSSIPSMTRWRMTFIMLAIPRTPNAQTLGSRAYLQQSAYFSPIHSTTTLTTSSSALVRLPLIHLLPDWLPEYVTGSLGLTGMLNRSPQVAALQ